MMPMRRRFGAPWETFTKHQLRNTDQVLHTPQPTPHSPHPTTHNPLFHYPLSTTHYPLPTMPPHPHENRAGDAK